jgi:hypothetical protein
MRLVGFVSGCPRSVSCCGFDLAQLRRSSIPLHRFDRLLRSAGCPEPGRSTWAGGLGLGAGLHHKQVITHEAALHVLRRQQGRGRRDRMLLCVWCCGGWMR